MDKINQLSTGEKIIAGAGIVMLIASFLPWYRVSFAGFSASANGWEAPGAVWSILAVLVAVAMAGAVLASRLGNVTLPDLGSSVTWGMAYLGGGVLTVILVVLKLINESSNMAIGFYLGIICAIALAAGGYLLYSEEKGGGLGGVKQ